MALLGVVSRQTRDCDVLHPNLPEEVRQAAAEFASREQDLSPDWLNNGPSSLAKSLPSGWEQRVVAVYSGRAIRLHTLGRQDLLLTKLFALRGRGQDLEDCVALRPTSAELRDALPWFEQQDAHPAWPAHVRATIADLAGRHGHVL